ncbi:MAG: glycosyltransferase [Chitinophagaceae bacterium]|nr:glycosyltransferase [Chitinophagaceae bacterium]
MILFFNSDLSGFNAVELIIIDDGSPKPVENLMSSFWRTAFLHYDAFIETEKCWDRSHRNRGFREARSPVVLFLDDDIILYKDTIKKFQAQRRAEAPLFSDAIPLFRISHQHLKILPVIFLIMMA